ncbi:MAG: hypothetical protein ACK5M7_20320 [Draconibacterium sp.]
MLKIIRFSLFILIFVWCAENSSAQDISMSVDSAFQTFSKRPPAEKLYLHLDRNTYSTGGTIWFRAYLVTATGHLPATLSNFIYVELFDQADSLVYRKKIKRTDNVFSGNIKLDQSLPDGSYFIRAYTSWMLNTGLDFAFYKSIHIGNLQPFRVSSKIEITEDETGKKTASIYFADKKGKPVSNTRIRCTLHLESSKAEVLKRKTGEDGKISFDFDGGNTASANQFIEVAFEDSDEEYSTKFFLDKADENEFDVQFFPEGGDLIEGVGNRVTFKAIGRDGYSRKIWGLVLNSKNDTVATLSSLHLGMGTFYMIPEEGEEYHALIKDADNHTITVPLPEHLSVGAALAVSEKGGSLLVNVRQQNMEAVGSYYLMAHSGELLLFTQLLENTLYRIPKKIFPEGIIDFVLLNDKKQAVSSRMVFVKSDSTARFSVQPDKSNYGKRELISLKLALPAEDSIGHSGSFSMAVTDDLVVDTDSLSDNIYSTLLLSSDLKGYIENPGFYFLNNADSTNFYLDLLMMTQGWKRFDVNELLQRGIPPAQHYLELGQTLSGKYDKMLLQRKKTTEITALSVDPFISASTFTDEDNHFIFNELDFPDSTVFTVQAQRFTNIKQEPAGIIEFDKDTFPSFSHLGVIPEEKTGFTGETLKNATERVYYEDGGKMIVLDEIRVDAADKTKHELETKYGLSGSVYDEERMAAMFPTSLSMELVIRSLPGVARIENSNVYLARGTGPAEIFVDGMDQTLDDMRDLYSDNIDHIAVVVGPGAAVYSRRGGGGGVIMIELKEGGQFEYELKGVKKIMPLGYQKPVEFYVPKYEIDSIRINKQPDMRSTVYWNPQISVGAGDQTTVSFYAADPVTTYTYIVEGIGNDGTIYRVVGKLRREED